MGSQILLVVAAMAVLIGVFVACVLGAVVARRRRRARERTELSQMAGTGDFSSAGDESHWNDSELVQPSTVETESPEDLWQAAAAAEDAYLEETLRRG